MAHQKIEYMVSNENNNINASEAIWNYLMNNRLVSLCASTLWHWNWTFDALCQIVGRQKLFIESIYFVNREIWHFLFDSNPPKYTLFMVKCEQLNTGWNGWNYWHSTFDYEYLLWFNCFIHKSHPQLHLKFRSKMNYVCFVYLFFFSFYLFTCFRLHIYFSISLQTTTSKDKSHTIPTKRHKKKCQIHNMQERKKLQQLVLLFCFVQCISNGLTCSYVGESGTLC